MAVFSLLENLNIKANEPVLFIIAKDAMENLLETIEVYCPHLKIDNMTKIDVEKLLTTYGDCVINYHPENYHQERTTLLKNFEMLKRYGLTDDDYDS